MNEHDGMMQPVDSTEHATTNSMGFTNPVMDYDPAEYGEEPKRKLYDSNEISAICGISLPRLSQLRTGQTLTRGDKTYVFEPLLEKGSDYIMDGSRVLYTEEACKKLKERAETKKVGRPKKEKVETPNDDSPKVETRGRKVMTETPLELSQKGFILVNEVSEKMNIKRAKLYTIFYKYKNGVVLNEDGTPFQIEEGKDFISKGGRIAIHKDLVDKMTQSTQKPKAKKETQSIKISLICGDRILKVSKEESEKILQILSETSKSKLSESF